jgi:hypothetical protein
MAEFLMQKVLSLQRLLGLVQESAETTVLAEDREAKVDWI